MTADRSLDEFLGADGPASDGDGAGGDGADAEDAGGETDGATGPSGEPPGASGAVAAAEPDDPGPVFSTYAWTPGGGPCGACGERVEERWREGEALVCGACKDW